jgi:hypothetical protein
MKKYVTFELTEKKPKTNVYNVRAKNDGTFLGSIYWHFPWRQYIFEPDSYATTIWSRGCLQQVMEFLNGLMDARKKR